MEKTKVSACIVTHNSERDIETVVKSLLDSADSADWIELTVYISDNESTDSTVSAARKAFGHDSRVQVIANNRNDGFGSGHNAVIPMLDSDYHIIVNPDISLKDDSLVKMISFMEENPDIGMLCPKIINTDGTEQILPKCDPKFFYLVSRRIPFMKKTEARYTRRFEALPDVTDVEFCSGCFMVVRTKLFKGVGGFDERYFMYFEDADLTRSIRLKSRTVMYRGASVIHRWERAGSKSFKFLMIQIFSMFKYFRKWRKK